MKPKESKKALIEMAKAQGFVVSKLHPQEAVRLMIDFYRQRRAAGCDLEDDGDLLLFQWGVRTEDDSRSVFYYDLTRQFMVEHEEHHDIFQLSLTTEAALGAGAKAPETGDEWCEGLDDIDRFASFIARHRATRLIAKLVSQGGYRVKLDFDQM